MTTWYLGYPIRVYADHVAVHAHGEHARFLSMANARLWIRRHRKARLA